MKSKKGDCFILLRDFDKWQRWKFFGWINEDGEGLRSDDELRAYYSFMDAEHTMDDITFLSVLIDEIRKECYNIHRKSVYINTARNTCKT